MVSFLSKVIEKIAAYQLITFTSGSRKGISTETILRRLRSDIYEAIDISHLTLLALFDVSAAFDTVDNEILFRRLQIFGLSGNFLNWLDCFLPLCGPWAH